MKKIVFEIGIVFSWLCLAGCGSRKVEYLEGELQNTENQEASVMEDDLGVDIWEDSFTAENEDGTVSVKIRAALGTGPETCEVDSIRRMKLDEKAADRIAKAALGEAALCEDGVYRGSRDGIDLEMKIGRRRILLYPADDTQVAPQKLSGAPQIRVDATGKEKNSCEMSEEDAIALAGRFLEELGFTDRRCYWAKTLTWTGNMEEIGEHTYKMDSETNGYAVFFEQTASGEACQIAVNTELNDITIWDDRELENIFSWTGTENGINTTCTGPLSVVCVNDYGVIAADIQNPYEITSIEEDVKILPLETVCGIMKQELTEHIGEYAFAGEAGLYYVGVNFEYRLIWDGEEQNGSYVPVWVLLANGGKEYSQVVVNAIDGSICYRSY